MKRTGGVQKERPLPSDVGRGQTKSRTDIQNSSVSPHYKYLGEKRKGLIPNRGVRFLGDIFLFRSDGGYVVSHVGGEIFHSTEATALADVLRIHGEQTDTFNRRLAGILK
jgi:hypothetical protein